MNTYKVLVYTTEKAQLTVEAMTQEEAVCKARECVASGELDSCWTFESEEYEVELLEKAVDPEQAKLEALTAVLLEYGFTILEPEHRINAPVPCFDVMGFVNEKRTITEIHRLSIVTSCYAEGLTAENVALAWREIAREFDPAAAAYNTLRKWDNQVAAAKNLREILEDYDAYHAQMRRAAHRMMTVLAQMDKKG